MRIHLTGINPPGRNFCRPDGSLMDNVHVGVQAAREPVQLIRADAPDMRWEIEVAVVRTDGSLDFRGPSVQGKRGDRFIYLTWGHIGPDDTFEMFRRAKLMLDRVAPELVELAVATGRLDGRVDLTGDDGGPRCARVDPPAIAWSVEPA